MFLAAEPELTIDDLRAMLGSEAVTTVVRANEIYVDLTNTGTISFRRDSDSRTIDVPANSTSISHLADMLNVPGKFLSRQDSGLQELILRELIARRNEELRVAYVPDQGISSFHGLNDLVITNLQVVSTAGKIFPGDAEIVNLYATPDLFTFEVVASDVMPEARLGDPQIDDITKAGLRFELESKGAPRVMPFQYRPVCTNGMVTRKDAHALDARGQSVDEVLDELERQAQLAFARVEHEVQAFYDLRNVPVENPERVLARVANEHGLSSLMRVRLIERAAELESPTMFDVIGLITNAANDPRVKPAMRHRLQTVGGAVAVDSHSRCGHCSSRLN